MRISSRLWTMVLIGLVVVTLLVTATKGVPLFVAAQGPRLHYGETVDGQIGTAGRRDDWSFDGSQGDLITIEVQQTGGGIIPTLALTAPDGILLASTEAVDANAPRAKFTTQLRHNGQHSITVGGASNTTGSYALTLTLDKPSTVSADTGTGVTAYGRTVSGTISNEVFRQFWAFQGGRGDVIDARMSAIEGDLDAYLSLLNPEGLEIAASDSGDAASNAALLAVELPSGGTYTLIARRAGANFGERGFTQGAYDLTLSLRAAGVNENAITPTELVPGSELRGRLTANAPSALYKISATGVLALRVEFTDPSQIGTIAVMTPERVLLKTLSGISPMEISVSLAGLRDVFIEIHAVGLQEEGSLDFSLLAYSLASAKRSAEPLIFGQSIALSNPFDAPETWYFLGQAGDSVRVSIDSFGPVLDAAVRITGPDGQRVIDDLLRSRWRQSFVLTEDGPYELALAEIVAATGYQIRVDRTGVNGYSFEQMGFPQLRGSLEAKTTFQNELIPGQADLWVLEIDSPQNWRFDLTHPGRVTPLGLVIQKPDGTPLAISLSSPLSYSARAQVMLPSAGLYRVIVFEPTLTAGSNYALSAYPVEGGLLAVDFPHKGVLTADDPDDLWRIAMQPHSLLNITVKGLTANAAPVIHVIGPNGQLVASAHYDGGQVDGHLLSVWIERGGSYQIVATQAGVQGTAIYRITASTTASPEPESIALSAEDQPITQMLSSAVVPTPVPQAVSVVEKLSPAWMPEPAGLSAAEAGTLDTLLRGEIAPQSRQQVWSFALNNAQSVLISAAALDGAQRPSIIVANAEGATLADALQTDDSIQDLWYRFAGGGTYYVIVRFADDAGGRYSLWVRAVGTLDQTLPGMLQGRVIEYGDTQIDELDPIAEGRASVFYGGAGDVVTASVRRLSGTDGPSLHLMDAAQRVLATGTLSADPSVIVVDSFTLPSEGMYILKTAPVEGQQEITQFALYLGVERTNSANARGGGLLMDSQVSSLTSANPRQRWLFDARAGERVTVSVDSLATGRLSPLEIALADTAGNVFLRKESQLGSHVLVLDDVLLPRTGVYQAVVSGGQQTSGDYRVSLERDERRTRDEDGALGYGETTGKVLTRDNYLDVWTFAGSRGDVVSVTARVVRGDPALLNMQLRAFNGQILGTVADATSAGASHLDHLVLPFDGHYSLLVGNPDGSFDGESAYEISVRLENSRARSMGAPLSYGDLREGRFYVDDTSDVWLFEGRQGDTAAFVLETDDESIAPTLSIVSTDWQTPVTNALPDVLASGQALPGQPAQINWQVPISGTYALYIQNNGGGSGQYRLLLERSMSQLDQSRGLVAGLEQGGELGDERPVEYWTFEGQPSSIIDLRVIPDVRATLLPVIELLDFTGAVLARAEPSASGQASLEGFRLPAAGQYTVKVSRMLGTRGATRGQYSIALRLQAAPVPVAHPIGYNQVELSALNDNVPGDWWSFEGQQGTVIRLRMEATSGTLDPVVTLYTRGGQLLASDDDLANSTNTELFYSLPADGTYLVHAQRHGGALGSTQGNYLITIEPIYQFAPLVSARFITYGDRITSSTDNQRRLERWAFAGQRGDIIQAQIQFPIDDAPLVLTLRDPAGNNLAAGVRDRGDVVISSYTLPADGSYVLDVQRPGDARSEYNPYSLTLGLLDATAAQPAQGGLLSPGQSVTGLFTQTQNSHIWMFEGKGHATAHMTLHRLSGPLALTAVLFSPDGTTLFTTSTLDGGSNTLTTDALPLPVDGVYLLVITQSAQVDPGASYRLSIRIDDASAAPLATLSPLQDGFGTLTNLHPADQWQFDAQAGDVVALRAATLSGDLQPTILLLRPDGVPVQEGQGEQVNGQWQAAIDGVILSEPGTYTVTVARRGGEHGGGSGDYRLMLRSDQISAQAALAKDIAYDQVVRPAIPAGGEATFAIQGKAGDVIGLAISESSGAVEVEIQTEAGKSLASARTNRYGEILLPALALPETGRYIIRVTHPNGGPLTFVAFRRPATVPQGGVVRALSYGQTLVEGILNPAQLTQWEFHGRAGEVLTFNVDTSEGRLRADITLYGPTGYLGNAVETADGRVTTLGPIRLPVDGDYRLIMQSWLRASSGSYSVRVDRAEAGVSGSTGHHLAAKNAIGYGGLIVEDPEDSWTFEGTAGAVVDIRVEQISGEGAIAFSVTGPDDVWTVTGVTSTTTIGAELDDLILPADGLYRVTVRGQLDQGESVEYQVSIGRVQSSILAGMRDAQAIEYGVQQTARLEGTPGDSRAWVFYGQRGETVRSVVTPITPGFSPLLYLVNPRGEIAYVTGNDRIDGVVELHDFTLEDNGFYGLIVKGTQGDDSISAGGAEFTISLEKLAVRAMRQGALADGEAIGDLDSAAPLHSWELLPAYSGLYRVSVHAERPGLLPGLAVQTTDGMELASEDPSEAAQGEMVIRLSEGERYFALVSGGIGPGQGRYSLRFEPASVKEDGGTLALSQADTGLISLGDFTDTWLLSADSAASVTAQIRAVTGDLALSVGLYDGQGALVAQGTDSDGQGVVLSIPAADDVYTLLISRVGEGAGRTSGQYTVVVESTTGE